MANNSVGRILHSHVFFCINNLACFRLDEVGYTSQPLTLTPSHPAKLIRLSGVRLHFTLSGRDGTPWCGREWGRGAGARGGF